MSGPHSLHMREIRSYARLPPSPLPSRRCWRRSPAPPRCRRSRRHAAMPGRAECRLRGRLGDVVEPASIEAKTAVRGPYVGTVRSYGLDLGITDQTQPRLGRVRADQPDRTAAIWPAITAASAPALRSVSASAAMSCRRSAEFFRAAAAQRAGPDRAERRGRDCRHAVAAVRPSALGSALPSSPPPRLRPCHRCKRPAQAGLF